MGAPGGAAPGQGAPGGGRGAQTPEQLAAADELRTWRLGLSMDIFKRLRKMYNDAGRDDLRGEEPRRERDRRGTRV